MKVWVLLVTEPYEGSTLYGMYTTPNRAGAAQRTIEPTLFSQQESWIWKVAVDAEPHAIDFWNYILQDDENDA